MIYFTSDDHFGHKLMIDPVRLANPRPFDSIEEHDEWLIGKHNGVVRPEDDVYNLGDFGFIGRDRFLEIIPRLNGTIHWVPADPGHDTDLIKSLMAIGYGPFDKMVLHPPMMVLRLGENAYGLGFKKTEIVMCHYPLQAWYKSAYGSIHLHGHWHAQQKQITGVRRLDVSVEGNGFRPYSLKQVLHLAGASSEMAPGDFGQAE